MWDIPSVCYDSNTSEQYAQSNRADYIRGMLETNSLQNPTSRFLSDNVKLKIYITKFLRYFVRIQNLIAHLMGRKQIEGPHQKEICTIRTGIFL